MALAFCRAESASILAQLSGLEITIQSIKLIIMDLIEDFAGGVWVKGFYNSLICIYSLLVFSFIIFMPVIF